MFNVYSNPVLNGGYIGDYYKGILRGILGVYKLYRLVIPIAVPPYPRRGLRTSRFCSMMPQAPSQNSSVSPRSPRTCSPNPRSRWLLRMSMQRPVSGLKVWALGIRV